MSIPPREGSRDSGKGIIVSIYPDWCFAKKDPVPFTVYAIQEEDANTAPSVRMTGQRAHNMASMTTCCHGDEPGVAGVISGTVGSVCEPKTHSATVRIEGKPAIRHNDEWWMNNKNTIGKLYWIESTESFEPTPPIKEYEEDDSEDGATPAASPIMSDVSPEPLIPGAQYAQALPNSPPPQPLPKPSGPTPSPKSSDKVIYPDIEQWKSKAPKPSSRWWKYSKMTGRTALRRLPLLAVIYPDSTAMFADFVSEDATEEALIKEAHKLHYDEGVDGEETRDWLRKAIDEHRLEKQKPEEETDAPPVPHARTEENVSVKRDEDRDTCEECVVGPYSLVSRLCTAACGSGAQAHHIVPDFTKRYGNRAEGLKGIKRVPGLPSFGEGASICLMGGAKVENSEHWEAHGADEAIKALGHGNAHYPAGTAPFGKVVDEARKQVIAMKADDPACVAAIKAEIAKETAGVNPNTLARTTPDKWPAVGTPAYEALSHGMSAIIH